MKKILMLLVLAGNICQPAYGFSLNNVNSLFSSIKDSISSYSSQLLETFNEHKMVGYTLAAAIATTFSIYSLANSRKNQAKSKDENIYFKIDNQPVSMKRKDFLKLKKAIEETKPINEEELILGSALYLLIREDNIVNEYTSFMNANNIQQNPKIKSSIAS